MHAGKSLTHLKGGEKTRRQRRCLSRYVVILPSPAIPLRSRGLPRGYPPQGDRNGQRPKVSMGPLTPVTVRCCTNWLYKLVVQIVWSPLPRVTYQAWAQV